MIKMDESVIVHHVADIVKASVSAIAIESGDQKESWLSVRHHLST
jgi:hypothetical protein